MLIITMVGIAFLCREYHISKSLVKGQQRYKPEYSFIKCFQMIKQLRDECKWPDTEVFAFIPRLKVQGTFYKSLADFAAVIGMTRGQIDAYKSRHHYKNMIEALLAMQRDRIPAYKTEYGLLSYSEARKKTYTYAQMEKLEYIPEALPRYPTLQVFDFTQDSMVYFCGMRNYFKSNLGVSGNGGYDRKTMPKIYEKRNMPMAEKYYSMEFLRKVQKWEEAYKKWSRELNTVDTKMQQYILAYLEKEETGVQEMIEEIIAQLPGSSTKRMLIDKVENLEMQERHGFAEEKNCSVPVVKKINI